jgi:hypothetical protein
MLYQTHLWTAGGSAGGTLIMRRTKQAKQTLCVGSRQAIQVQSSWLWEFLKGVGLAEKGGQWCLCVCAFCSGSVWMGARGGKLGHHLLSSHFTLSVVS